MFWFLNSCIWEEIWTVHSPDESSLWLFGLTKAPGAGDVFQRRQITASYTLCCPDHSLQSPSQPRSWTQTSPPHSHHYSEIGQWLLQRGAQVFANQCWEYPLFVCHHQEKIIVVYKKALSCCWFWNYVTKLFSLITYTSSMLWCPSSCHSKIQVVGHVICPFGHFLFYFGKHFVSLASGPFTSPGLCLPSHLVWLLPAPLMGCPWVSLSHASLVYIPAPFPP